MKGRRRSEKLLTKFRVALIPGIQNPSDLIGILADRTLLFLFGLQNVAVEYFSVRPERHRLEMISCMTRFKKDFLGFSDPRGWLEPYSFFA